MLALNQFLQLLKVKKVVFTFNIFYWIYLDFLMYKHIFQYKYNYIANALSKKKFRKKFKGWFLRLPDKSLNKLIDNRFIYTSKIYLNTISNNFILQQRIPTTKKNFNKSILNLQFKSRKLTTALEGSRLFDSKKNKHYFLNLAKSILGIYFVARKLQWSLWSKGTVKQHRYSIFLKKHIKSQNSIEMYNYNYYLNYLLNLNVGLDWKQLSNKFVILFFGLSKHDNKQLLNQKIIQVPINTNMWRKLRIFKNKQKKCFFKAKNWSYLRYIKYLNQWMLPKKNFPKFFKKINPTKAMTQGKIQVDLVLNACIILKNNVKFNLDSKLLYKYTSTLKLYNYRYKA